MFIVQHGNRKPPSRSIFYFGPETTPPPPSPNCKMDVDEATCPSHESPRPRKHRRDSTINGLALDFQPVEAPAAKRTRRNNGVAAAATANGNHAKSSDAMYIAQQSADSLKRDLPTATAQSPAGSVPVPTNGSSMEVDGSDVDVDGEVDGQGDVDADADDDALQAQLAGTGTGAGAGSGRGSGSGSASSTLVPTLTNGCSVGVQSDKVTELGPETTVLTVPDKSVTHAIWNPHYPTLLATAGEALCRIWTIVGPRSVSASSSAQTSTEDATPYIDLHEASDPATVTSLAWSPDGETLAVATYGPQADVQGSVTLYTKAGVVQDEMPGAKGLVLKLSWNPSGTLLLGVAHSGRGTDSTLVLWDIKDGQLMQPFDVDRAIIDVAWIDDRLFGVCGKDFVAESIIENQAIAALKVRDESNINQEWTTIEYDRISRTKALIAESTGMLALIDPSGHLHVTTAHDGAITSLMYQPISNPSSLSPLAPRSLATSSVDGTIKLWDAKRPFAITHTLGHDYAIPPLAISFTPDGCLVAAASWNKVLIWSAELGGTPKASWKCKDDQWQTQSSHQANGDVARESEEYSPLHSLSWDADSGKLAYGLKNQVSFYCDEINLTVEREQCLSGISDCHHQNQRRGRSITEGFR